MRASKLVVGTALAALLGWSGIARAAPVSLVGQLDPSNAQDVVLHAFTLSAPGTVSIQSWGYGSSALAPGGTNAQGAVIGGGGFDPYVTLFTGSGPTATFLASNDDGSCPPGTVSAALCGDSTLTTGVLPAGAYTLAISAFLNMSFAENLGAGTLGDGFIGLGSFGAGSNVYAVDIAGATLVTPTLLLSQNPNGLTFGPQTQNVASGPLTVVVTNVGSGGVALGALTVGGPDALRFAASSDCPPTLATGANCTIAVVFTPNGVGPFSATVTLASNASNAPTTIAVGGTGTAAAVGTLTYSPPGISFGARVLGTPTASSIVVTNIGGASVQLGTIGATGANPGDFALGAGCNGVALAPAQTCTIDVTFTPGALGVRSAALTIPSDASNGPTTVGLDGVGALRGTIAPVPLLSPAMLALLAALMLCAGAAAARRRNRGMRRMRVAPPPSSSINDTTKVLR
ncbi:MAG: DVUA0089 family protein [Betaproteobacteria bacterium]